MTGQQLRNSILQEAIQGRLVPNVMQPGEKTGAELLQGILEERQKKENEEKGKKAKRLILTTIEEEPWNLPEGWCWARLGDIVDHRSGLWEGKKPPFIRVGVIRNANFTKRFTLSFDNIAYLNVEEKQYLSRKLEYGDIIIEKSGGGENQPVGRPVLFLKTEGDFSFSNFTQMLRIADKALILPMFLQQVLMAFYVSGVTINLQSNTTNLRNLDFKGYLDLHIPLPPLSIQKAIVEKIEELFPLVDEYEKAAVELNTLNELLPDKLRKSVLQEAIHGKLVSNDIPDGEATAPELLQQILKERQDRENKEKGKKAKKLTLSTIDEEPWELPKGWCWCTVNDIVDVLDSQRIPVSQSLRVPGSIPYYGANGILDYVNDYIFNDILVLLGEDGAKWGAGEPSSYIVSGKSWINNHAHVLKCYFGIMEAYLMNVLNALDLQQYVKGTTVPKLNQEYMRKICIPLPPLSIQHRIVEKIEEVFSAIDKLQA